MTYPLRTLVGCAALAAGLWLVSGPAPAGVPDLPKDSYKKAADADLKFLQARLDDLAAAEKPAAASADRGIATAILLATYADGLGDAALKADALKVAEAVHAKKYKDAADMAKKLAIKPGTGKAGGELPKLASFEAATDKSAAYLAATMSLYSNTTGGGKAGGMNIQKDLREWTSKTNPPKLDLPAVEVLAARSAVINEYALIHPNEKARNSPEKLKEWQKFSKDSVQASQDILAETAKKTPDLKTIRAKLTLLDAACTNCHGKYRDTD